MGRGGLFVKLVLASVLAVLGASYILGRGTRQTAVDDGRRSASRLTVQRDLWHSTRVA